MLKKFIEKYIQKTKNPHFKFDEKVDFPLLFSLAITKILALAKGIWTFHLTNGNRIFMGKSVKVLNKKNIALGNNITIGDYVTLSALGTGALLVDDNVNIGAFSQLVISTSFNHLGSFIKIGSNVGIGEFSYIGGGGGTSIGADTIIGQYFSVHPENHNFLDNDELIRLQGVTRKGISVGSNCWIGAKVTILDGVKIGDNCVIAAGSIVTKCFDNNSLIGGVPAKVIKTIS